MDLDSSEFPAIIDLETSEVQIIMDSGGFF
jgi:hypothetical protein